jgi:hypothetical protein
MIVKILEGQCGINSSCKGYLLEVLRTKYVFSGYIYLRAITYQWQGKKDSNLRMLESKSSALTSLAIPLLDFMLATTTAAYYNVKHRIKQSFFHNLQKFI